MKRYAVASAFVGIGVAVAASACGGTKYSNDAQAWTARPDVNGGTLSFRDGSVINVEVVDAAGDCYALGSVDPVEFTTSTDKAGKADPSTIRLMVSIEGREDCSLAGP
jgi:hypothetical protein